MRNNMKKIINSNIYVKDLALKILFKKLNNDVLEDMERFSQIDSISNIGQLYETVNNISTKKGSGIYAIHGFGAESLHYGHIQNLYKYAGLKYNLKYKLPMIEHGITYDGTHTIEYFNQGVLAISQGNYMKNKLRSTNKYIPLFCIGPYIHYAEQYYSEEKIKKMKNINGKTLLVFPHHNYEGAVRNASSNEFIDYIFKLLEESYDKLYVCSYWLDLDSDMIREFKRRGATIVSAGARFDPLFLHRLKTIISLSDVVYANDIGTNIGYSMYLKKPYYIAYPIKENTAINRSKEFIEQRNRIIDAFSTGELRNEKNQVTLYNLFWGGEKLLKEPSEITSILELNDSFIKKSKGNTKCLAKLAKQYRKQNGLSDNYVIEAFK